MRRGVSRRIDPDRAARGERRGTERMGRRAKFRSAAAAVASVLAPAASPSERVIGRSFEASESPDLAFGPPPGRTRWHSRRGTLQIQIVELAGEPVSEADVPIALEVAGCGVDPDDDGL